MCGRVQETGCALGGEINIESRFFSQVYLLQGKDLEIYFLGEEADQRKFV